MSAYLATTPWQSTRWLFLRCHAPSGLRPIPALIVIPLLPDRLPACDYHRPRPTDHDAPYASSSPASSPTSTTVAPLRESSASHLTPASLPARDTLWCNSVSVVFPSHTSDLHYIKVEGVHFFDPKEPLNKRRKRVDLVRQGSGWSSFRCAGLLEQAFSRSWVRLYVIVPLSRRSDAVVVSNAAAADTD